MEEILFKTKDGNLALVLGSVIIVNTDKFSY